MLSVTSPVVEVVTLSSVKPAGTGGRVFVGVDQVAPLPDPGPDAQSSVSGAVQVIVAGCANPTIEAG